MKKLLLLLALLLPCNALAQSFVPDQRFHGGQAAYTNKANVFTKPQVEAQGTFANAPSASTAGAGAVYYATDLGTGVELVSNGSKWKPATGSAVIYQHGESTGTTNSASEVNLAIVTIPAALLSTQGSLRITATAVATGANSTKNPSIRFSGTSADTSGGTQIYGGNNLSSAQSNLAIVKTIWNRNSTSAQVTQQLGNQGVGTSSNTALTVAQSTSSASYLNFNGLTANSGDTVAWAAITVEWIEP